MNTKQLYNALIREKTTRNYFDGIFSKDTLSDIMFHPRLIICNTDNSYEEGSHWVLFYFHKNKVDFYDPLGKDIMFYGVEFYDFIKKFSKSFNQCKIRTQPVYSSLCGVYCLYFAFWRCQGISFENVVKSMNKWRKVLKLVKIVFKLCNNFKSKLIHSCKQM